ncbi:MAG: hypothetical protein E7656_08785 [Ruminococcaceae bacterium]|nr:hypothetical protein [Oscillospiraceae bacterium]
MKKIIALALVCVSLASLAACGPKAKTGTCDLCGKEEVKVKVIEVEGEEGWFCDDCYEGAKALAELAKNMEM